MHVDPFRKEIIFKIVYYGPGLGGKTTNLEFIYSQINPKLRGELVTLKTKEDRTLYFDFLQLELGRVNGKKPRFHLYTIPGQVYYGYSRKIILKGADAVVFVADSQSVRMDENWKTLADLEEKLILQNKSLTSFPWVLQYNKRDLPNIETVRALQTKLNFFNVPFHEAMANKGQGVFETLRTAIQLALAKV
ncbi:MAG: GTPase domain-containing protein [Calditrichaeota bacterium]|nr:gliding-motility protein MglA [Actinomycetota bacterium]NOY57749.1 GTPase domain-containing protein [Calditrichota bacterium]